MLGRMAILSMGLMLATPVLAQQGGTSTNGYSAAQRASAEAAAKAAGYTVTAVADAQGGAMFLWAMKEGRRWYLTVTADGKVYAGGTMILPIPGVELRPLSAQ
jgi:hypothetical protein